MRKMMRNILFAPLVLLMALTGQALALEKEPFSEQRFAELQKRGEVVLIDVFADWCSTCARQQKVLQDYRDANPDNTFHVLEVNFDRDKQWVRHFRAPRQSTLLLYAGDQQFWYSVAETRPEIIHGELDKAIRAVQ